MAPLAAPAVAVNIRVIGALGPPPPYRPIVQTSQVFERGPAPDLEPWRIASLAQAPVDREVEPSADAPDSTPADTDWTISREPDPVEVVRPPAEEFRFEVVNDDGERGIPVGWHPGPPPATRGRRIRTVIWAGGIALAMLGGGAALYAERGPLRRLVSAVTRVDPAPAPADRLSTSMPENTGADCADDRGQRERTITAKIGTADCAAGQSEAPLK